MQPVQQTRHRAAKNSVSEHALPGPEIHPIQLWKWLRWHPAMRFESPYSPPTVNVAPERLQSGATAGPAVPRSSSSLARLRRFISYPRPLLAGHPSSRAHPSATALPPLSPRSLVSTPGFSSCNLSPNLHFPATGPLQKVFAVLGLQKVIFLKFTLETALVCNLRPNGFHVQPPDVGSATGREHAPPKAGDYAFPPGSSSWHDARSNRRREMGKGCLTAATGRRVSRPG